MKNKIWKPLGITNKIMFFDEFKKENIYNLKIENWFIRTIKKITFWRIEIFK